MKSWLSRTVYRLEALSWGCLVLSGVGAEFHVDPSGRGGEGGDATSMLVEALGEARRASSAEPRRIVVHEGCYENVQLTLGPADSGLEIVAAPGVRPRLLGGQRLKGWQRDGDRFWSAELPTFPLKSADEDPSEAPGGWEVRSLLVGEELAPRARYPAEGRLTHRTSFDVPWMSSTGGGWKRRPTEAELTTLQYQAGDVGEWLDTRSVEVTVFHMWDESCVGVVRHDPITQTLHLQPRTGHPPGAFGVKEYVLWNLREGMTRPGQWFHDRSRNRIVYWPRSDEEPNALEIVVPTTRTILGIRGEAGRAARGLVIRGLELASTTVPLRAGGFGADAYPGAIALERAEDCRLEDLTIRGVAGQGIRAGRDVQGIAVVGCEVSQCGAGGIYVGGRRALIEDNEVHGIGGQYPSAIGIYRGGRDCVVRHNTVHDCSYSAINYGGTGNVVENNLIYDCMKVLHDGAAIYMFAATNCVLRGNLARDIVDTGGYGASAYYLDERSSGCVVEKNVSLRVGWPTHNHMATNNVIRNNLFFVDGDAKLTFPRSTGYTLERNLLVVTGKIRIDNVDAVARWDRNLFYSEAGRIEQVKLDHYSARETVLGPPGDTVIADPRVGDWRAGDTSWAADSPAHGLGIEPVDVRGAGCRVRSDSVD